MPRGIAALVAVACAAGCLNSSGPSNFVFQYGLNAWACDTTCATPGDSIIASAARGDTIWVSHVVALVAALSTSTPTTARLRPECAQNVAVLANSGTIRSLPEPTTCPDSTYALSFALDAVDYPSVVRRYTRWVIDSGVAPGDYGLRGRMLVKPRLEPTIIFTVN